MDRELISQAMGDIADRHVAGAIGFGPEGAALREGSMDMKRKNRVRTIAVVAAAAALLLALGVTAYAAGWLDSIFGQAAQQINTNDEAEERIEAAAAMVSEAPQEPETRELPGFDSSKLTLKESYYDGQGLLLGVDLDAARPDPVVGFEPDGDLLERIVQPGLTYQVYYSTQEDMEQLREFIQENTSEPVELDEQLAQLDAQEALTASGDPDDLDHCLDTGYISQDQYDESMRARTQRGAAAGLHYESAICLDTFMEQTLTGEEYEQFWNILEKNGAVCVVMEDMYVGDHMLAEDGVDLAAMQTDVTGGTFVEAQSDAEGKGYLTAALPEELKDLDELHIQLKVKGGPVYYYMTLDGRAYALHEQGEEQLVSFTVPNSAK